MPFFTSFAQRLWSFVSPRKTQRKRDVPFKPKPHKHSNGDRARANQDNLGKRLNRKSMSPNSRVKSWRIGTPSASSRSRQFLTPHSSDYLQRHRASTPRHKEDGDSDIDPRDATNGSEMLAESVWDTASVNANDDTHVVPEDEYEEERKRRHIHYGEEIRRRESNAVHLRQDGWTEDAIAVITRISLRGLQPLMPLNWAKDFETFPIELFTADDDLAFLKSISGNDFRAMIALRGLIDLGPKVRDRIISRRPPESVITRAITAYNKWAHQDADLPPDSTIPNLVICSTRSLSRLASAERRLCIKFSILANRYRTLYRVHPSVEQYTPTPPASQDQNSISHEPTASDFEYTRPLPTLYGVVVNCTQMAFVSYDPAAGQPSLKAIASFDWENGRADVWNSLAVAILVTHCRDRLVELSREDV